MSACRPVLLLIDDTTAALLRLRQLLREASLDVEVLHARDSDDAVDVIGDLKKQNRKLAGMIVDLVLRSSGMEEALELIHYAQHKLREVPILIWTKTRSKSAPGYIRDAANGLGCFIKYEEDDLLVSHLTELLRGR